MKDTKINKGKDHEISKWEEEVRKSLATKSSTSSKLTKQQEALVKAQLQKEESIRQNVKSIHSCLIRGLYFIRSLVEANVQEMHVYMSSIVTLLLSGALKRGSFLAGPVAFETYLVHIFYLLNFFSNNLLI